MSSAIFPKPRSVHCKEGCLKISVINKPRGCNFLDSETLHLLLKAGGGHVILPCIYYSHFTTIFYVLQQFGKSQSQIQEVNLYHQLSLLGNACIFECLSGKQHVSAQREWGSYYFNTRLCIYSSDLAHTIALGVTKNKQQNIICSNLPCPMINRNNIEKNQKALACQNAHQFIDCYANSPNLTKCFWTLDCF